MIILFMLYSIIVGSHAEQLVPVAKGCENKPHIHYLVEQGVVCIPSDSIFKNGFSR